MKDTALCLWCGIQTPNRPRRGSARRFCRTECRQAHHAAMRRLGASVTEEKYGAPRELQMWQEKRARFLEWRRRVEMSRASPRPK